MANIDGPCNIFSNCSQGESVYSPIINYTYTYTYELGAILNKMKLHYNMKFTWRIYSIWSEFHPSELYYDTRLI